jgi:hypothetical protein
MDKLVYWGVSHDWDKEEALVCQELASLGKPIASRLAKQWREESEILAYTWQLALQMCLRPVAY